MSFEAPKNPVETLEGEEAPNEKTQMDRMQMELTVSSIDPKNSPDSWRAIKKELDESGWDYITESTQYQERLDDLIDAAAEKGNYTMLKEIIDIFGEDGLSASGKEKIRDEAKRNGSQALGELLGHAEKGSLDPFQGHFSREDMALASKVRELGESEQTQLAEEFFQNTIGRNSSNNRFAYPVYGALKGTPFALRFKELESERLEKAGYGPFTL